MALKKVKVCSFRLSEELLDIIDQQIGESFTAKFERLIYNCYMLQAQKEAEIQRLDVEIASRCEKLKDLRKEISELQPLVGSIKRQLSSVDRYLEDYIEDEL